MENGSMVTADDKVRDRDEAAVGGVGEVPEPPWRRHATEEGKGGASNNLRTAMEGMDEE